jgi:hypothetical protein
MQQERFLKRLVSIGQRSDSRCLLAIGDERLGFVNRLYGQANQLGHHMEICRDSVVWN